LFLFFGEKEKEWNGRGHILIMATVFLRRGLATTAGTVAKAGAGAAPKKAAEGSVPTSAKTAASAKTTTVKKAAANKAKEEEEEGKEIIPKYWPTLMPQENLDALKESYMEHQLVPWFSFFNGC